MKVSTKLFVLTLLLGNIACSIIDGDSGIANADIDYLFGVEESGKIRRQINFSDSDDEDPNSVIEYTYNGAKQLISDQLFFYVSGGVKNASTKNSYKYENNLLIEKVKWGRNGAQNEPLEALRFHYYAYPDGNRKIETVYKKDGMLHDSIIYTYTGGLLMEERHFNHHGEWGRIFRYNSNGKLYKTSELDGTDTEINYFDERGILKSSSRIGEDGESVMQLITYDREVKNGKLVIRKYLKDMRVNTIDPFLASHRIYENGKMIEEVVYHPTMGGEWYCCRYEYY